MWKANNNKRRSTRIDTLIGQNTHVTGDLAFAGGLHVSGKISGNVKADTDSAVLSIAEEGCVMGEVQVMHIVLDGTVEGDVYAEERVELGAHAKVTGNVYYNLIEMAVGASVNGKLVHRPKAETRLLSHDKSGHDKKPGQASKSDSSETVNARNGDSKPAGV